MQNILRWAGVAGTAALTMGLAALPAASNAATQAIPQARSSLCNYTGAQPLLVEGSSGTAVKQAQCELNWAYANGHGLTLAVDGQFGSHTLTVTRDFQACVHIAVDGKIGPDTWSLLNFWVNQPGYACG